MVTDCRRACDGNLTPNITTTETESHNLKVECVDLKMEKIIISEVTVILIIWKESDTPTHAHT